MLRIKKWRITGSEYNYDFVTLALMSKGRLNSHEIRSHIRSQAWGPDLPHVLTTSILLLEEHFTHSDQLN